MGLVALNPPALASQTPVRSVPESVTVAPGRHYRASGLHAWLMGTGYRDVWTSPFRVEVADLRRLRGGLTPFRLGGGKTTRTLHLRGADGHGYVFRSVEKHVEQGLPEELHRTPVESALQDQISAFHPTGAPVVAALLDAVGALHTSPRFLVLPDSASLGGFGHLAGSLVLFEERPDAGWKGARSVIDTPELFDTLAAGPAEVDAAGYLSVRLVDLLVGDRDRSVNNWLWAGMRGPRRLVWRPVPVDRDQAFMRLDGMLKGTLKMNEPRLVRFDEGDIEVKGLSRSAWDVDRRILTALDKLAWDSVTASVLARLTDSVIDASVRRLPPEHYRLSGSLMARRLKARRMLLRAAGDRLYRIVAEYADLQATDQPDLALIERTTGGDVRVRLYSTGQPEPPSGARPFLDRLFRKGETKEVRLYLRDAADHAVVRGAGPASIRIRVVGGGGRDVLADSTETGGRVALYDAGDNSTLHGARATTLVRQTPRPRRLWGENSALPPDWGRRRTLAPVFSVNRDIGLLLGPGTVVEGYGFRKFPSRSRTTVSAAYSTGARLPVASIRHELLDVRGRLDLSFLARFSGMDVIYFHGLGNETIANPRRRFHRVTQRRTELALGAAVPLGHSTTLTLGPAFIVSHTDTAATDSTFLSLTRPFGSGTFRQAGAAGEIRVETRNRGTASSTGWLLATGGGYYPGVLDVPDGGFGSIHGELTGYFSTTPAGNLTAAVRVGGKRVFGRAPFYESAFIGGWGTVRGLRAERFGGSASAFANLEVRGFVTRRKMLVPTDIGILALADAGRVFQDGEESSRWHSGVGGGLWIAPVRRHYVFSLAAARSREGTLLYLGTGFMY
jgi:hypothetical protein